MEAHVRRCECLASKHVKREKGKQKKTWTETIKKGMMYLDISERLIRNRVQ